MNKLRYKLRYHEACCLRDYLFKVTTNIKPQAAFILSSVVAVSFALKLSSKLVLRYNKSKTLSIPYSDALAIYILSAGKKIGDFTDLEMCVILPLIKDVESKIIYSPEFKLHA